MASRRGGRLTRWLVAFALSTGSWPAPGAAQTLYPWPDTTVDLSRYSSVEQCLAAVDRTQWGVEQHAVQVVWLDTMEWNPQRRLAPPAQVVTSTAARCAARYNAGTAELADYNEFVKLFLEAGRDTDAAALVARRVAAATTDSARAAVIDTAAETYLSAQPVRLQLAEALLREQAGRVRDPSHRLSIFGQLLLQELSVGDTLRAHGTAGQILTLYGGLAQSERETVRSRVSGFGLFAAIATYASIGHQVMLDSLRKSTSAYLGLMRHVWADVTGQPPEAMGGPIGQHAPKLTADFWFPAESSNASRPVPGRVTLVQFLGRQFDKPGDPAFEIGQSPAAIIPVRRLVARFPAVQVIFVAETRGYYWYEALPKPAEEAARIRAAILGQQAPPEALLAVSTTPFGRLVAPDGRRINGNVANDTSYAFRGQSLSADGGPHLFLVDQNGIVVAAAPTATGGPFDLVGPLGLERMIAVLLQRSSAGDSSAPTVTPSANHR